MTDTTKPTLVIDLDGTILDRRLVESLRLYLLKSPATGRIFPRAQEALRQLADQARIVAVTARCVRGQVNTDMWLAAHDLDFIPALHSPCFLVNEPSRVRFKRRAIAGLKEEGHRVVIGVGDRGSDLDAYLDEGLFPVMVSNRPGKRLTGLLERIADRRLEEGKDYLLIRQEPGGEPLWQATAASVAARLADLDQA